MDFELSEREKALADRIEKLVVDADDLAAPEQTERTLRTWFARLGEAGYLAAAVGRDGRSDLPGLVAAGKELAKRAQWLVFAAELNRMVASLLADHGSGEQIDEILNAMLSGEKIAAAAFTESGRGTEVDQLGTRAEPDGGGFSVCGVKSHVSLAPAADLLAVLAATPGGPAVLLVERQATGVRVGEPIDSLGYPELLTCPVEFDDVRVEKARVVGPFAENEKPDPGERLRRAEDRAATACALGIAWLCLDEAKRAANRPGSTKKPPAGYQAVRFALAEMLTLAQTAEWLALRAACLAAAGRREADTLALCAKVFATETACKVSDSALSILASSGYRRDDPVARALVNARFGTMTGHCSNAARMAIADDALARLAD